MSAQENPASETCASRSLACSACWPPQTPDEILQAYPYIEAADIDEALRYAASLAEDETIELHG